MRVIVPLLFALAGPAAGAPDTPVAAPASAPPLAGGPDFISPAGEPVHSPDHLSGAEHWFEAVDANHDGRLSKAEMHANAAPFFARLDADHDGEIDPAEIDRYETQIAPEIRVYGTSGGVVGGGEDGGEPKEAPYPDRLGAGRFGYIDLPEPIIAMDLNFDRGISRQEFDRAIDARFAALDTDRDGFIDRDELPKLGASASGRGGGHGRDGQRGGRGHGSRGGGGQRPEG